MLVSIKDKIAILFGRTFSKEYDKLSIVIFVLFLVILSCYLPVLLSRANEADRKHDGLVLTVGDDINYQAIAVNLLHGLGFADTISLPLETYRFDLNSEWGRHYENEIAEQGLQKPSHSFYRAPGFPLLLSSTYAVFGYKVLVARKMLAVLAWLTSLLALLTGAFIAGWLGTVAGGFTALYYLNYSGMLNFERILTEIPAAFWVMVFCFFLVVYLRNRKFIFLILWAISLGGLIFSRVNFLPAFPFILLYLYFKGYGRRDCLVALLIIGLPIIAWCIYASTSLGRPIMMTTQGERAFQECNNIDTLEGIGPQRWNQGGWNPGWVIHEDGTYTRTGRHAWKPGENGWVNGLTFWWENLSQLPRLFYVKLRRGFWYNNGLSRNRLKPEGLYLIGIGFLLCLIGLRPYVPKLGLFARVEPGHAIIVQLALISMLSVVWNKMGFWLVIVIWFAILLVALLRPYGDAYELPFVSPVWFLSLVACHAITTVLFLGVRYHEPLDVPLMLFGFLGILLSHVELFKKKWPLSALFFLIIFGTALYRFGIV